MRLPHEILSTLAAFLLPGSLAAHTASIASSSGEQEFYRLMAHTTEVEGEPVSYFTYRPETLVHGASTPLLLVPAEGEDDALAWAQDSQLFEIADAQGALLVLIEGSHSRDRRVLDRVLDELTDEVG